jgi:hypothetical protein
VTGPLYLALGVVSALKGLGVLSWSWLWVGGLFVAGTLVAYAPELWGKSYTRRASP